MEIQWDPKKNRANLNKHGVSFEEASELFKAPGHLILELYDFEHSIEEDRIISIGPILQGVIVVVLVERDDGNTIRLISARFATKTEKALYSDAIAGTKDE